MFSYLRPHRRTPSNPSSPVPDQAHSWEPSLQNAPDSAYQTSNRAQDRPQGSGPPAPLLLPNSKSASYGYDQAIALQQDDALYEDDLKPQQWGFQANARGSASDSQQWAIRPRPDSAGSSGPSRPAGASYPRPQTGGGSTQGGKERLGSEHLPFVTAGDIQSSNMQSGRRPAGMRMSTASQSAQSNMSTFEPTQPRSGKTRLNLLNPMSLLARRRTAQVAQYPTLTPSVPNLTDSKPLDGYDPRIRGTKVHDFSAPRARRNVSYNDVQGLRDINPTFTNYQPTSNSQHGDSGLKPAEEREPNRWSGGNHTPAFTEDFDEEQYPAAGPHVRKANDFTDLQLPTLPYARRTGKPSEQGLTSIATGHATAQLAQISPELSYSASLPNADLPVEYNSIPEAPTRPAPVPAEIGHSEEHIANSSKSSSTRRPRNISQVSAKDIASAHLPKHMKSTSSRFSFDMIGAASQEKLLEDRHRQKALEKKSVSPDPQDEMSNYGDEEYDYDNMFEDDGLEERIPGVNTDAEDDEVPGLIEPSLGGFTFHSMGISTATSPLSPRSPGMVSTPRDANGEVIGFAITKESPNIPFHQSSRSQSTAPVDSPNDIAKMGTDQLIGENSDHGLALQAIKPEENDSGEIQMPSIGQAAAPPVGEPSKSINEDDDLYFDDGLIDLPSDGEDAPEFDESVFDNEDTDDYGRPLRPLSSLPTLYSPPYVNLENAQVDKGGNENGHAIRMAHDLEDPNSAVSAQHSPILTKSAIDRTNSLSQPSQQSHSLTQDSLDAYQSALAAAAYKAAANGRFRRDSSPTMHFDERDEYPDVGKDTSNTISDLPPHQQLSSDYEDDFDYDDALEDDPIIAEANAEALANDSDGFYGQEFGFYSAPAAGDAQFGGYFGPRGANGAIPNQNGRVLSREPNLTPITERSEYSNRNSVMSLPLSGVGHVVGSGTLNSPGLIQLAGMMNEYDEENMSLEALLKLRRGAWGGSQASLQSSTGNGSPMSAPGEEPGLVQQSPLIQSSSFGHSRDNSGYSARSDLAVSEASSAPGSPTLTMSIPSKTQPTNTITSGLPAPSAALLSSLNSRPISPTSKRSSAVGIVSTDQGGEKENALSARPRGKHHHSASSDSISYMKEDDPVVGERWVLERRRTAESGEVEILGREVVSGGRI